MFQKFSITISSFTFPNLSEAFHLLDVRAPRIGSVVYNPIYNPYFIPFTISFRKSNSYYINPSTKMGKKNKAPHDFPFAWRIQSIGFPPFLSPAGQRGAATGCPDRPFLGRPKPLLKAHSMSFRSESSTNPGFFSRNSSNQSKKPCS